MIDVKLLGLVLGKEIEEVLHKKFWKKNHIEFWQWYNGFKGQRQQKIVKLNLDTLTRKMKEWVFNGYTPIESGICKYRGHYCRLPDLDNLFFEGKTELEAVIKATEWVAKKKGLL